MNDVLQYKSVMDTVLIECRSDDKRLLVYFGAALECDQPILEALFVCSLARVKIDHHLNDTFGFSLFQLFYQNLSIRGKRCLEKRGPWREVFRVGDRLIRIDGDWKDSLFSLCLTESDLLYQHFTIKCNLFIQDRRLFAAREISGRHVVCQLRLADKFLVDFPDIKLST
jgi:hypothetical protein